VEEMSGEDHLCLSGELNQDQIKGEPGASNYKGR
jgi:hypothetical protein